MAYLTQITEARTWYSHINSTTTSVTADTTIVEISTIINNVDASLVNIQAFFDAAGKLYLETEDGDKHYITDSETNYPANFQIIATYFLEKGKTVLLKYSTSCNMTGLIISHNGGVF